MTLKHLMLATSALFIATPALAQTQDPDARAAAVEAQMTDNERFGLLHGVMPIFTGPRPATVPAEIKATAGYIPGIPRLQIPALLETDASLGVVNPLGLRPGDTATALPASMALAASFDTNLAYRSGEMLGEETRAKGFNVLLAGGVNLARDWFGGRNFEYLGEDPLLAGVLAGDVIRGVQSKGVMSTVKHFVLNAQETQRRSFDARIGEGALRESDLLAFQIAIERGQPASVMCAYNLLNGEYTCGSKWLLDTVLKQEWKYKGWVMSDWGTTYDVAWFNNGLDQQSGENIDTKVWFDEPLKEEYAAGRVTKDRLSDAVRRILRSIYAVGADKPAAETKVDVEANARIAGEIAEQGIVLLKNDGALPLANKAQNILVVGGFADRGVLSGGGSSSVTPPGGMAAIIPMGGPGFLATFGRISLHPSSPLDALRRELPAATIAFDNAYYAETAAARAAKADLVIVVAHQWQTEGLDSPTLTLPQAQDELIAAVARANPNTIVVLQTGNPVTMPWLDQVKGVVQAWYPGQRGGDAIAGVLSGRVNPSGRLPMTFPKSADQSPRPTITGLGLTDRTRVGVDYVEGADVGYRWYSAKKAAPLFPFGYGLSYTKFEQGGLSVRADRTISATFTVRNTGKRAGADAPQVYLTSKSGAEVLRLVGFQKVQLAPGQRKRVTVDIDPRLLASWRDGQWRIDAGDYKFALGASATDLGATATVKLGARAWGP